MYVQGGDLGNDIEPCEGGNVRNLKSLGLKGRIGDVRSCCFNFSSIVGSKPDFVSIIGVDGWRWQALLKDFSGNTIAIPNRITYRSGGAGDACGARGGCGRASGGGCSNRAG
jgi:hypothetical protein